MAPYARATVQVAVTSSPRIKIAANKKRSKSGGCSVGPAGMVRRYLVDVQCVIVSRIFCGIITQVIDPTSPARTVDPKSGATRTSSELSDVVCGDAGADR